MLVELVLHFTCLVPLAWILGITLGYGLMGIWSAAVVKSCSSRLSPSSVK